MNYENRVVDHVMISMLMKQQILSVVGITALTHLMQLCHYDVSTPKNKNNFCLQVTQPKSHVVIEKTLNLCLAQAVNQNNVW